MALQRLPGAAGAKLPFLRRVFLSGKAVHLIASDQVVLVVGIPRVLVVEQTTDEGHAVLAIDRFWAVAVSFWQMPSCTQREGGQFGHVLHDMQAF